MLLRCNVQMVLFSGPRPLSPLASKFLKGSRALEAREVRHAWLNRERAFDCFINPLSPVDSQGQPEGKGPGQVSFDGTECGA